MHHWGSCVFLGLGAARTWNIFCSAGTKVSVLAGFWLRRSNSGSLRGCCVVEVVLNNPCAQSALANASLFLRMLTLSPPFSLRRVLNETAVLISNNFN